LALAVFCFSYLTKPTDESDVLKKAIERQMESLVSVEKPLETDTNVLTKEEELKNSVYSMLLADENFTKDVSENVASNASFVDTIYKNVLPQLNSYLDSKVNEYVELYTPQIEAYVETLYKGQDPTIFVDDLIAPVTERVYEELSIKLTDQVVDVLVTDFTNSFIAAQTKVETDIYNRIMANREDFIKEVETLVLNDISAKVPDYEEKASNYIDNKIDLAKQEIIAKLPKQDVEAAVIEVYNKYQDQVIVDVVNQVLSKLDTVAVNQVAPVMPVSEKVAEPVAPVVPTTTTTVVETPKPTAPTIVKAAPSPVTAPVFAIEPEVTGLSETDYQKNRTEKRNAAIQDILTKLK
ncbi:MAG: hypothetical protein GX903_06860, partial [Spirochaetales bacterium]|nr:hypothetical protein [Spirochaetales bacterium]